MITMRSTIVVVLWLAASAAGAQQSAPAAFTRQDAAVSQTSAVGEIDFGFRGTLYSGDSDEARYQRYRDLRNGPFIEGFRWGKRDDRTSWDVRANHVGYRDQRYEAAYNSFGKLKVEAEWDQIPLFFSRDTRTAFAQSSSGVLTLEGLPRLVQTGAATTGIYNIEALPFDLRLKRNIANVRLVYSATPSLDLTFSFKNTQKTGEQPWAGTFGFADAVELPAPVDTRTTEVGASAEWTNTRGAMRVGYDGSFFRNNVATLTWDNPLRFADSPTAGPAQGRMALWPNSSVNSGSVSGLVKLPASSQATAYVSLGNWSQNDALIPLTTNTALAAIPLDRQTADASARVSATAFSVNSRPVGHLWLNARFRSYDFDNRTPVFAVSRTVSYDTTVAAFPEEGTSPYSFTRKTFDFDASWTPITFAAFRAAYTREAVNQTFRSFDTTTENTVRLSADATIPHGVTLRAVYEHATRVGSGLDEQVLDDIGEQVSLRQFDISDRDSNRVSAVVIVTPVSSLSFNGTAFLGREDRPGAVFGLRSNDNTGGSIGFDFVPNKAVSVGGSYEYEKYSALQASRQANPGAQFNDPTRDWTTDSADRAHTLTLSADLLKLFPKTDVRFAYDLSRAESVYVYGQAANTTLAPVLQLPAVHNTRNRFSADARHTLTRHLGAGVAYWYEKYDVDDFAFAPTTLSTVAQPSFISLAYLFRPYTANTLWGRLTYTW